MSGKALSIRNEFAHITVRVDERGLSPRLVIHDELHGLSRTVDPLELECFARAETGLLDRYLPYERHNLDGSL